MTQQSQTLFEKAKKLIPGGVNSPVRAFRSVGGTPFFTKKADGCKLTTADDRELLDYVCTWGPAIHGHNHPKIREAVAEALERGTSFGTPGPAEVEMAELIVDLVPSVEKVRMCNSGTEATMSAIRLARGFTGRDKIIKFAGCYHGHVDSLLVKAGSGALTLGNPDSAGIPKSLAQETIVLPYNDSEAVRDAFMQAEGQVAAIIVEPFPANCGLILPVYGYLEELRKLCNEHGALLIFDEVMTGFRLGSGGVQERVGVTPTSLPSEKSLEAVFPSEPLEERGRSWTTSHPWVPFTRQARSVGIHWPWPRVLHPSECFGRPRRTSTWRKSVRCWRRELVKLPAKREWLYRSLKSARCSVFFSATNR